MTPRDKCFTYKELMQVRGYDNNESLVNLATLKDTILIGKTSEKMIPYIKDGMYLRQGAADKLIYAQALLRQQFPQYSLEILAAYRHPEIQRRNFDEFFLECKSKNPHMSHDELYEYAHHFMAIPEVAGHPTGAAVDVLIVTPEGNLDMGSEIADLNDLERAVTYSKKISNKQLNNRLLLRAVMQGAGFAPYDFEWWHFSYGDREWACYYNYESTVYLEVDFRRVD